MLCEALVGKTHCYAAAVFLLQYALVLLSLCEYEFLLTGWTASTARISILCLGSLREFTVILASFLYTCDLHYLHLVGASTVSGFFASACSLPFDYVKTQIQKMQPDAEGKYPYKGSLDCALKTLKAGGPLKFYTGFPIYCVRIAPHVMVCYS